MSVPPEISAFVADFYRLSDDPDHDAYCALFTPDASFLVGTVKADGQKGIREVRSKGWNNFNHREHKHEKTYVNKDEPDVALVTGTIDYDRKDGVSVKDLSWAGRITFDRSDGLRVKDYYVWVVSDMQDGADSSRTRRWDQSRRTGSDTCQGVRVRMRGCDVFCYVCCCRACSGRLTTAVLVMQQLGVGIIHFMSIRYEVQSLLLIDGRDEVDLNERVGRQLRVVEVDARRPVLAKVLAEDLLESRKVALEVLQVAVQLQDRAARAPALLQHDIDVVQDLFLLSAPISA